MSPERIYARDTVCIPIEKHIASQFVALYHKQGMVKQATNMHCYGLYHNKDNHKENLLAVIIFSTPRTKKKRLEYKWELLRMCFRKNTRIVGGASKLIKYFIKTIQPVNFFTYQDTSGETTDVYQLSGMILRESAKPKKVLVRNGLTYNQAENNRRDWFSFQQASMIGPDALLKTQLGEHYDNNGKRLNNIELFVKHCGYHIETINGDRVYDWHNDNYIYYTYKITASDSDKYYYGRKSHYIKEGTVPDKSQLINDGYYGSGGVKFKNWKNIHKDYLHKEILATYDDWSQSILAEKELIGELYKNDPNFLNSIAGGLCQSGGVYKKNYTMKHCPTHGETKHSEKGCCKCNTTHHWVIKKCPTHGETKFVGDKCFKCIAQETYSTSYCTEHGETTFINDKCYKCTYPVNTVYKHCDIHGDDSPHTSNGDCKRCMFEANKDLTVKQCMVHGETTFSGNKCLKCAVENAYSVTHCEIHGEAKHKNNNCVACLNYKKHAITVSHCDNHGFTKHIDGLCYQCFIHTNPKIRQLLDSRRIRNNTKNDMFACPDCGSTILSKVNNILNIILEYDMNYLDDSQWLYDVCKNCRSYEEFLNRDYILVTKKFLPDFENITPKIMNTKDNRVFDFTCPCCSDKKTMKFTSFVKKVQKGGTVCKKCKKI